MRAVLSFVLSLLLVSTSQAAVISIYKGDADDDLKVNAKTYFLQIRGEITPEDVARLQRSLSLIKTDSPYLLRVYLDSSGGNVRAAIAMGRLLRPHGAMMFVGRLNTETRGSSAADCYSACVTIFASGRWRWLPKQGSELGVHQFSSDGSGSEISAQYLVAEELAYYKGTGIDSAELNRIAKSVLPNRIQILSKETLFSTKLVNDGEDPAYWHVNSNNSEFFLAGSQETWMGKNKVVLICKQSQLQVGVFADVGVALEKEIRQEEWRVGLFVDDRTTPLENFKYDKSTRYPETVAGFARIDKNTAQKLANIMHKTGVAFHSPKQIGFYIGGYIKTDRRQRDMLKSFIATCH